MRATPHRFVVFGRCGRVLRADTKEKIYTYTGKILVALNPFGALSIYGEDHMAK